MAAPDTYPRNAGRGQGSNLTNPLRVNQIDALYLDNELTLSLRSQFVRIFKYLPMDFVMRYEIEIDYFIQSAIYYFSIYKDRRLNGDKLQNIQFGKKLTIKQKAFYFLFTIVMPYLFKKWMRYMDDHGFQENDENDIKHKIYALCIKLSIFLRIISLIHLILFLFDGKYRSVISRILRIKMKYINPSLPRLVSFDFMNQQIVWNEISNFLLFVLPLINFHKISFLIKQQMNNIKLLFQAQKVHDAADKDKTLEEEKKESNRQCLICGLSPITIPCKANCSGQHLFCYYCLSASLLNQGGRMRCPLCYDLITQHQSLLPLP